MLVHRLATHPDRQDVTRDRVARGEHAAIEAAIEEVLRIDDPFVANRRRATREARIGGCTIPAGDRVVLNWTAANRDPSVFGGDPDEFRPEDNAPHNLAFGAGPHVCPGRALTLMELRTADGHGSRWCSSDRVESLDEGPDAKRRPRVIRVEESDGPAKRARTRASQAAERAEQLEHRLDDLSSGTSPTSDTVARAREAAEVAQRLAAEGHQRAAEGHRRAANAHRLAAELADGLGHHGRAAEHRSAARADEDAAAADDAAADVDAGPPPSPPSSTT